jgi:acetate kinase
MKRNGSAILAINGGSSSIKFALYGNADPPQKHLSGTIDRIGLAGATLTYRDDSQNKPASSSVDASDYRGATAFLIDWLEKKIPSDSIYAVVHRVVHGMQHTEPARVTPELIQELHRISPFDPDHLPAELQLIEGFQERHPELPQVACFDTAFHSSMPRVAKLLPIPRRFEALGVQRYGFHGLSYTYLMEELARTAGTQAAHGRVILAHLGNGASLAAVRDGQSIDTTMGFTPAAGLPMGTRPGDLDPGLAAYLMRTGELTASQFNGLINRECGLLGISEISSDMRDLIAKQSSDIRAAEAVEFFCYQTRKWIGGFAAALGGLDTLVFAGGIGENAAEVRSRVCGGLEFLGVELDEAANACNRPVISASPSSVAVRVIPTDEELMLAREARRCLAKQEGV